MVLSLMPAMAFGVIDLARTEIIAPSGSVPANDKASPDGTEDGQEFKLILTNSAANAWAADPQLYVASSRPTVDTFFYKVGPNPWTEIPYDATYTNAGVINLDMTVYVSSRSQELTLKVVSSGQGTSRIAFGTAPKNTMDYAASRSDTDASLILNSTRYPIEFTAPKAGSVTLGHSPESGKYANGVDSYTLTAVVLTNSGIPASGIDVTFRVTSGTGATLSASRATTNAAGKAEVRVYSNRQGEVKIQARVTGIDPRADKGDITTVYFDSTGVTSIKAESGDNQKKAREDGAASFRISAYDVNGNRVDFTGLGIIESDYSDVTNPASGAGRYVGPTPASGTKPSKLELYAEIVRKPSGAALAASDIYYGVHKNSGNLDIKMPFSKLNRDGEYEVKVYLPNGVAVIYTFSVKDLGDVVKVILDYGSTSFAAGTFVPEPGVIQEDEDGYSIYTPYSLYGNDAPLSISDASYLDGKMQADGSFKLKDDKSSGTITMTLVDKTLNLVGSQTLNIEKAASYLVLTPRTTVGAVGGEVTLDIELVDVDGKQVAVGLDALEASATVVSKPDGAVASASNVDTSDFKKGKANVKVSSNMEGDVVVRVIITERTGTVANSGVVNQSYDAADAADAQNAIDEWNAWEKYDADMTAWAAAGSDPADMPDAPTFADPRLPAGTPKPEPYKYDYWLIPEDTWGGRTYTGAQTVSFGKASAGGGTLIFIIGAPSYVAGSMAYAAESPAFIEGGRTFLGVRDIGTAIGAAIDWDQDTETATIAKDNIVVKVTVGAESIVVSKNGVTTEVAIDAPAQNKAGRVYLPFRALLEAFGYTVSWDEGTQSIICTI